MNFDEWAKKVAGNLRAAASQARQLQDLSTAEVGPAETLALNLEDMAVLFDDLPNVWLIPPQKKAE